MLPCLSEPCESRATAINNLGVISGAANDQAVLWHPSGTSGIPEVLLNPDPRDETSWAMANDVLDDGTAGGSYDPTRVPWTPNEVPVISGAGEAVTELPLPEGFLDGSLRRLNDSRDGVGVVRTNDGTDPTYVYGALWINDGGSYVTVPLTYFVNDITPRAADGSSFLVASDAGRMRLPYGYRLIDVAGGCRASSGSQPVTALADRGISHRSPVLRLTGPEHVPGALARDPARADVRQRYFFFATFFFATFFVAAFFFVAFFFVVFSFCLTSPNFACAFPRVF